MKIMINDVMTGDQIHLVATFTTDHSASSYGQAVMYIDEWSDCMSHQNWVLGGGVVIEATQEEKEAFIKWHGLIDAVGTDSRYRNLPGC